MFAWTDLISDLQTVIRQDACDPVTRAMLRLTCKAEHAQPRKDNMLNWLTRAAAKSVSYLDRGSPSLRSKVLGTPLASFFRLSCSYGYLEVCKFVFELGQLEREILPQVSKWYAYGNALQNGHLEVADWAFATELSVEPSIISPASTCVRDQNLNGLKWLFEHHFEMPAVITEDASDPDLIEWLLHTVGLEPNSAALNKAYLALPASRRTVLAYLNAGIEFRLEHFERSLFCGYWNILDFWKDHDADLYEQTLSLHAQRLHEMRPALADNERIAVDSDYDIIVESQKSKSDSPYSILDDFSLYLATKRRKLDDAIIGTYLGNGEVRLHATYH
jgi:hypothetical protein